jgi:hypothetical protein
VAGPNTCQTMCDVSRGINDRDRPSEGQVSEIKASSAYRTSGNRGSGIQEACACDRPSYGAKAYSQQLARGKGLKHIGIWPIGKPGECDALVMGNGHMDHCVAGWG